MTTTVQTQSDPIDEFDAAAASSWREGIESPAALRVARWRPRPASQMLRPYGSRNTVRQLLEHEPEDAN